MRSATCSCDGAEFHHQFSRRKRAELRRWHSPSWGGWTQEDPIGFEAGDWNKRRYVRNEPTNASDPSGLQEKPRKGKLITDVTPCRENMQVFSETDKAGNVFKVNCVNKDYVGSITFNNKDIAFGRCVRLPGKNCWLITYDENGTFQAIRWYNWKPLTPKQGEVTDMRISGLKTKATEDAEAVARTLKTSFYKQAGIETDSAQHSDLTIYLWEAKNAEDKQKGIKQFELLRPLAGSEDKAYGQVPYKP